MLCFIRYPPYYDDNPFGIYQMVHLFCELRFDKFRTEQIPSLLQQKPQASPAASAGILERFRFIKFIFKK